MINQRLNEPSAQGYSRSPARTTEHRFFSNTSLFGRQPVGRQEFFEPNVRYRTDKAVSRSLGFDPLIGMDRCSCSASSIADLQRNHLLSLLRPESQQRLQPLLTVVDVDFGEYVSRANQPNSTVYFPLSCVTSSLKTTEDGITMEMATVGHEGFVGLSLLFGAEQEPMDSIAQIDGEALSMSAKDFLHTIEDATIGLREILMLYAQALLSQVVQNAACNRAHSIEQRCARWILMTHERTRKDSFILGHLFIAYMLVIPEAAVTGAMETLVQAHLITYTRNRIHILNREQLEKASCECYGVIKRGYDRLLDTAR